MACCLFGPQLNQCWLGVGWTLKIKLQHSMIKIEPSPLKMNLKMLSAKRQLFCFGLNDLKFVMMSAIWWPVIPNNSWQNQLWDAPVILYNIFSGPNDVQPLLGGTVWYLDTLEWHCVIYGHSLSRSVCEKCRNDNKLWTDKINPLRWAMGCWLWMFRWRTIMLRAGLNCRSNYEHAKDIPYLTGTRDLWCAFCEYFWDGTGLYLDNLGADWLWWMVSDQTMNSRNTPHTSPLRARHGVSFVRRFDGTGMLLDIVGADWLTFTKTETGSNYELTKYTPYLTPMSEVWGIFICILK